MSDGKDPGITNASRELELALEIASMYRSKALYFCCLAKRRFRPQFDICRDCKRRTEEGEFCEYVHYEIDCMSGKKEDEPKEQAFLGNDRHGKPKRKRPKKKPRDQKKARR